MAGLSRGNTSQPQPMTPSTGGMATTPPRLNNPLMDLAGGFTGPNPNAPAAATAPGQQNRMGHSNWFNWRNGGNDSLIRMLLTYAPPGGGQWGR